MNSSNEKSFSNRKESPDKYERNKLNKRINEIRQQKAQEEQQLKERRRLLKQEEDNKKQCFKCKEKQEIQEKSIKDYKKSQVKSKKTKSEADKNENEDKSNLKSSKKKDKSKVIGYMKLPKNINEYRHLIKTNQLAESDIKWVIDLREKNKQNYEELLLKVHDAPSFYHNDSEKYKSKKQKERKDYLINTQNCFNKLNINEDVYYKERLNQENTYHLYSKRPDFVINKDIVEFEGSLRNYRSVLPKDFKSTWTNISSNPKSNFLFSEKYPMITNKAKDFIEKNKTFSLFPIETKVIKALYNDRNIFKKTVSYDKTSTGPFLGEHHSFSPYNKKDPQNISYSGSNLQEIRHLLKGRLQSNLIWEIGLRNNLNVRSDYIKNELYENGEKIRERKKVKKDSNGLILYDSPNRKRIWDNNFTSYPNKSFSIKEKLKKNGNIKIKSCLSRLDDDK